MQDPENTNPTYLNGHLQSTIVGDSSLQSQYETLLANHENLIRSRNQQVREIQESYLTTLKDLENVKQRMQEKKVLQDREINLLRDQHHENIRKTEIEFQKKIEDIQREKMAVESLLSEERSAKSQQIELNEQQKLQNEQLVQEQNQLKEEIASFLKRKSESELTFAEQQEELNQAFAAEREEMAQLLAAEQFNVLVVSEEKSQLQKTIDELQSNKAELNSHLKQAETERNNLLRTISTLEASESHAQTRTVALQSEIMALNEIILTKENQYKELETQRELQILVKNEEISTVVRFFLQEEQQVLARVQIAEDNYSQLENARNALQADFDDSQDLLKQYQTQFEQSQDDLKASGAKLQKMQGRLSALEVQLVQSQEKVKAADKRANDFREEFERMKIQHSQKETELQTAISALVESEEVSEKSAVEISGLRRSLIGEKKTNVTLRANINSLTIQLDDEQNKNRQKVQIIQNLEGNIRSINELTASQDSEIHNLLENQKRLSQEISSQTETINQLQKEATDHKEYLANANAQTFRLEQEKVQLQGKIRNLELGLTNTDTLLSGKTEEAKKLVVELSDLTDAYNLLSSNMQAAQVEIVESKVKIKHHQDIINEREIQLASAQSHLKELTASQSTLEELHVQSLEKISEMKEFLQGQTKVEQELRNHLQQKEELEQNISAQLNDAVLMVTRLKGEVAIYEESQMNMKEQILQADKTHRAIKDEWLQEAARLKTQVETLRTHISAENAELVILRKELDTKHSGLDGKEKQLRFYSESLNISKSDLRDQVNKLLRELQLFKSVNPMNDYYKLTQRELNRVELQLKKTPTASPDRSRLEECLAELIEQREFLSGSIERFQKDFDMKLERLSAMMGAKTFTLTPPPPPSADAGVEC